MSKSKYKYANEQAVRVRRDLEQWTTYYMHSGPRPDNAHAGSGGNCSNHPYARRGEIVHISHKANGLYKIVEDGKSVFYADDMFEPLKPFICRSLL